MMKRIFSSVLILTLLACVVTGIYSLFFEFSIGSFIYVVVMTPGNIIVPTIIGVVLFQFVKGKFVNDKGKKMMKLALIMCLLLLIGLISWSTFDVIFGGKHFGLKEVMQDFNTQLSGFAPAGFVMAIALPFIDRSLNKKNKNKHV